MITLSFYKIRKWGRHIGLLGLFYFLILKSAAQLVPGLKANGRILAQGDSVTICIGSSILYESTAQGASAVNWRFNNGTPATGSGISRTITYNAAGIDTTWQVISSSTDRDSIFVIVRVNNVLPTANFSFSPNNQCGDVPVAFSDNSTGNGLSYVWKFGDGDSSLAVNPSHQFLAAIGSSGTQSYKVVLSVKNDQLCTATDTQTVTVKKIPDASIGNGRSADVTFSLVNGEYTFKRCTNPLSYEFRFINASTTTSLITQYTIQWGDGISPDSVFTTWPSGYISHVFPRGKSIMKVIAKGSNGCIGIKTYSVFVGSTPAGNLGNPGSLDTCSFNSLTFPINNTAANAPGTTYTFKVNDGSASTQVFQHPPPADVTHFFSVGSCGITSDGFSNAFKVTFVAENPCFPSPSSLIVYISSKPKASISVSPSSNICAGTTLAINNASNFGGQIISTGGGNSTCSNTGRQVWTISPATGYTLAAGSTLGSVNGAPTDGLYWTVGSSNLSAKFTTPGTYIIKLYVANDKCGTDSITKTVCVRPALAASFTMNKDTSCAPDTVVFANTSPSGGCLGENYNWTVTYADPSTCGGSSAAAFVNGTSASSKDPQIQFTNPGNYTIRLTVTALAAGCTAAFLQDTFVAKGKPKVTLPALTVCLGNTVSPTATVSNCYSSATPIYLWTFTNGNPATSTNLLPGPITYTAVNTHPFNLEVTNECGVTTANSNIKIIDPPPVNAGADTTTCSGVGVRIGTVSSGYTYAWTPATGLNNVSIAMPTATFSYSGPSADTTFEYILKVSSATCFSTDTVHVTVKRKPAVTVFPQSITICSSDSTILTASGANSYLWLPATGLNSASGAVVTASPVNKTIYTVTGTDNNGCTNAAQATVMVTQTVIADAGEDTTVCNTATAVRLTGKLTSGGVGVWSGSFVTAAGSFNAKAAGKGAYKLYFVGTGPCNRPDSLTVTVIDPPAVAAGNDTTVCQIAGTIQLTGSPAGGVWSGSPQVTASGLFNTGVGGTYNLIYTFGAGTCVAKDTVQVMVKNDITNNMIAADQAICDGGVPATITGLAVTGAVYQWQQSADSITWSNIINATGTDYTPAGISTTTFFRRLAVTALCAGGNFSKPVKITINPDAKAVFSLKRPKACAPVSLDTVVELAPYNDRVREYRWYINDVYAGSGSVFPKKILATAGDTVTVKLVAVSSFGCKNDSMQLTFATTEVPIPSLTQDMTEGCGPLSVTFTNTTPNPARYSYRWDFGNGQTASILQPGAITFMPHPLNTDTTYTVKFTTLTECSNIILTKYVKVTSRPKALFTPNISVGCSGGVFYFTNTSRGNGNTYKWDFGDGTPPLITGSAMVTHIFHTGAKDTFNVKLVATNDCGPDSLIYAIIVNPADMKVDFAISGKDRFGCLPHTVRFINNSYGANIYNWNFGDGTSLTTFKGIDTIVHVYTKLGVFTTALTGSNTCSGDTTDTEIVTVQARPFVAFSAAPLAACIGDTIHLVNSSDVGINYEWKFGDNTGSSLAQPVKTYSGAGAFRIWLTGSKVYANGSSCSDSTYKDVIIRDTLPGTFTQTADQTCTPALFTFRNNTGGTVQTIWDFGDGGTAAGDTVTHTYTLPGDYTVKMVSKAKGGCNFTSVKTIRVSGPSGSFGYNKGYVCPQDSVRFEVVSGNSSIYRFVFGDGDSLTTTASIVYHQYKKPGRYIPYVWLIAGSCYLKLSTGEAINAEQTKAGFKTAIQYTCGAAIVSFTDTSSAFFGIRSWQWTFGDGKSSGQQNPVKAFTQSGNYVVKLLINGNSGCTDTVSLLLPITVHKAPVSAILNNPVICAGQPVAFTAQAQSQDAVLGHSWNFGNGFTASGSTASTIYNLARNYLVQLISRTDFGCADTVYKTITVPLSPMVSAGADPHVCKGDSVQLSATGATNWQWTPAQGLSCYTCARPWAKPTVTTSYVVTAVNGGCSTTDTVLVEVIQPFSRITVSVSPKDTICIGETIRLTASGAYQYTWLPAAGLLPNNKVPNPTAGPASTTLYTVVGSDPYNCFTDTAYTRVVVGPNPAVDLAAGSMVAAGSRIQFRPAITNGPIVQYTWTPPVNLSCTNCDTPVAVINSNIIYRLDVKNIYGCTASDTVSYRIFCDPDQVFIPNAFSPDGDGINDVFMIRGSGISTISSFRIFNRWGELVFEKTNTSPNVAAQGWDGKVKGRLVPDVYFYTAEILCTGGAVFTRKGNVSLMLMK